MLKKTSFKEWLTILKCKGTAKRKINKKLNTANAVLKIKLHKFYKCYPFNKKI